jgi:hypothetical protein
MMTAFNPKAIKLLVPNRLLPITNTIRPKGSPKKSGGRIPDLTRRGHGIPSNLQALYGTTQKVVHTCAITVPNATPSKPRFLTKIIDRARFSPAFNISEYMNNLFLPIPCRSRPVGVPMA